MSDVVSLSEARAVAANDSRLWSPIDCLRALVRDIENGDISVDAVLVHYYQLKADGGRLLKQTNANLTRPEAIAMIALAQHKAINDWLE